MAYTERTAEEFKAEEFVAFQAGIDAGVATVMSGFHSLNGVPCTGSKYLLTDVLRDKCGFDGFVVSDAGSVDQLIPHGYAEDYKDAAWF